MCPYRSAVTEGYHEDPIKVSCFNMEELTAKEEALDHDNI